MGFSVSGAAAIIFAGLFVAFGMFYTATANTQERINDANQDWREGTLDRQNTDIELVDATYHANNDSLIVKANNTGAFTLSVNDTDLLADNELRTSFTERTVDGESATGLWLSGQQIRYNVSFASQPDRIKLVTETGVAETEVVTSG